MYECYEALRFYFRTLLQINRSVAYPLLQGGLNPSDEVLEVQLDFRLNLLWECRKFRTEQGGDADRAVFRFEDLIRRECGAGGAVPSSPLKSPAA